jgi:hypothetical protein
MAIFNGITGQGYRYRHQKFTEHEEGIVALAVEASYSDAKIGRLLGRPENSVKKLRHRRGWLKKRGRGLWKVLAMMLAIADSPAIAHDPGEPFAEWFQSLNRPDVGGSCCSLSRDCQPATYRLSPSPTEDGSDYEVLDGDRWIRVPERAVIHRHDNPTGSGVLCKASSSDFIYCFVAADDL